MLLRENRLSQSKPPAPSPAVKMYREANDPNASPEERAIAKKELDVSLATTSAKLSAAQDANAPIDAGQVGQAKTGEPYSQIVPGWGAAASNKRQKLATATMDALQEENPSMSRKEIGEDLAWRQANWGGQVRSETQLQLMQSTTVQANKQLHFNVDQVSQLEKEMPGANLSPILNAIIRGEEKWTGDPKYSQLFYYMYAAGTESARLLSGGQASIQQLHEGAREEAKQWANAGWTTPDAWVKGVSVAMDKEADNKIQTYSDAMDYMKKRMKQGATSPSSTSSTQNPTYTPDQLRQAIASKKIKSGDTFLDPDGISHTVR
jgi:hypothetical protein